MSDIFAVMAKAEKFTHEIELQREVVDSSSREIAKLEAKIQTLADKKKGEEAALAKMNGDYDRYLKDLPKGVDAKKIRELSAEKVKQLAQMGLLETAAAPSEDSEEADDAEPEPSAEASQEEEPPAAHEEGDSSVDILEHVSDPAEEVSEEKPEIEKVAGDIFQSEVDFSAEDKEVDPYSKIATEADPEAGGENLPLRGKPTIQVPAFMDG